MIKLKQSTKAAENIIEKLKQEINHTTVNNCKVKEDDRNKSPPSVRPKWSNTPKTREEFLAGTYLHSGIFRAWLFLKMQLNFI